MSDKPKEEHFDDPAAFIKEIQERSDDIEKVVIYPPGFSLVNAKGQRASHAIPQMIMLLHKVNGETLIVGAESAEHILNDGILNRMRIKIQLHKGG